MANVVQPYRFATQAAATKRKRNSSSRASGLDAWDAFSLYSSCIEMDLAGCIHGPSHLALYRHQMSRTYRGSLLQTCSNVGASITVLS